MTQSLNECLLSEADWAAQPTAKQRWAAVDMDNTILSRPDDRNYDTFGDPLPGAVDALKKLKDMGWRISIYTARMDGLEDDEAEHLANRIEKVMDQAGIPYDDVWVGRKPRADIFIDDKAIEFDGSWEDTVADVMKRFAISST